MAWLGNFIKRNLLNIETNPDKVIEVKTDLYDDRIVISRDEGMFFYGSSGNDQKFEILLHKPCSESLSQGYSLFRSVERETCEKRFNIFRDKLPLLCNISTTNLNIIQKYCTTIQEHPTWSICHLVVYFNLIESILLPKIQSHINTSDPNTGLSPLQVAVKEGNLAMIVKLLQNGASVSHLDNDSNTVFHYAATTNKDILSTLAASFDSNNTNSLNHRNITGHTPLHVACLADKPDCVTALIAMGADVNLAAGSPSASTPHNPLVPPAIMGDFVHDMHAKLHPQEMKYGGTPLHWSSSREVIDALLDRNCDINALNFASRTALHVMVMRNRLECAVALLSREADPNIPDVDGNTALHLAVKEKNISTVQALIVFGADLNHLNHAGETARHMAGLDGSENGPRIVYTLHAVGASRCTSLMSSCTPYCAPGGNSDGVPPPPASGPAPRVISQLLQDSLLSCEANGTSSRGGRLLCLDGGGIRGLVLIILLLHLEQAANKPIIHCFDWMAATSTGGILALALAAGKTLKEALCLYFRMKDQTFSGFRPYSSEPLETMLKESLGTDTTMADIAHPKIMITGCLADRKPVDLHLFRNYEGPAEILYSYPIRQAITCPEFEPLPSYREQLLWEAARATGAAPSYFRSFGRFVDGGLIANNPTLDAITEIHEYNMALKEVGRKAEMVKLSVVVSLGTGSVPLVKSDVMDIFWPSGFWDTAKLVSGVKSMQSVLIDQATLADGRVVDRTRAICSMLDVPYFRFSPQLSEDIVMDEKSDVKLVNMLWETKVYIVSQSQQVNKLAAFLNC
uniref:phospholipase A2 n=1 Tax=Triatoma infestans TaxID=30076 RepID=A0A023F206_TRIIF